MKKTRKLIMVLLALTVAVSLCACGGGNGEKVQKEASGNEISGNSPADSSVDGENDIYLFDYELTFDSRTDTDGVMISGIKDETTKNMTFPQTRVSKYNDPMPVLGVASILAANSVLHKQGFQPKAYAGRFCAIVAVCMSSVVAFILIAGSIITAVNT